MSSVLFAFQDVGLCPQICSTAISFYEIRMFRAGFGVYHFRIGSNYIIVVPDVCEVSYLDVEPTRRDKNCHVVGK